MNIEHKKLDQFVKDKLLFTLNKDCEIKYNDWYTIESKEHIVRKVIIRKRGEIIEEILDAKIDRVNKEFSYYGIEVEVK